MAGEPSEGRRITAIGGGHGLARTLDALLLLSLEPTAIVTVADDGGSSGRLRQEHGVIALGDMRMALQTLAGADASWSRVFSHRFDEGDLQGHALGNLILMALIQQHDDQVVAALSHAANLLGCRGTVLPCTTDNVTLVAQVDGRVVAGQVAVATTTGRHRDVWLEPRSPRAAPQAVHAISAADVIVLGPGSLFTSIIPNLLVPGISAAIARSSGKLIYVANMTGQPGETTGMDLQDHVDALLSHLPQDRRLTVLAHRGAPAAGSGQPLGSALDQSRLTALVTADLATRRPDGTVLAAHDPKRLAQALQPLLA